MSEQPSLFDQPEPAAPLGDASPPDPVLPDAGVRNRIARDLGTTLFVSAGAGSGKTTQLVDRVLALVASGTPVEAIAAITFTEKAADELSHRVRVALERRAAEAADVEDAADAASRVAERCHRALDDLDQATICTLHTFAQRILTAFPVEAGLPPAISVLDEIASDIDFEERFQTFYTQLINRPELDRAMSLAHELGVKREHLREAARQLEDNWDRVDPPDDEPAQPPPFGLAPLVVAAEELLEACAGLAGRDRLADGILEWLPSWVAVLRTPPEDELDLLDHLVHPRVRKMGNVGTQAAWARTAFGDAKAARAAVKELVDWKHGTGALADVLDAIVAPILARIGWELAHFTLGQAEERRRSGRLTFHDLLVLCRQLVQDGRHGERVRLDLAARYAALLLDEYQDTDPLQLDIVMAIATPPGEATPRPGQLFFVGDPKQSLYRFRRADIDLFLRTPGRVGAETVSLTSNFRTTPELATWINHVFSRLIRYAETDDGARLAQPAYEPLAARPAPPLVGPPVTLLGTEPHPKKTLVGPLRTDEGEDVVRTIHRVQHEGWTVRAAGGDSRSTRPARLRDIAILIPARTSLGQLEAALRQADIPYRLDTGSLVYAADEIRALLLALRAIDDPSDALAVLSVLRSALYGCSDVDLYRWRRERGGHWNPHAPAPERLSGADPVWDGMADLAARIETRAWRTPSQQLDALVRDRRVLETALAGPSTLDAWHRVRFVTEQARAWSDAGGRFLRDYLDWTRRQTGLTGRVAETSLEVAEGEQDAGGAGEAGGGAGDDAVRILTVHGAKGLEFPVTIVCGFNSRPGGRHRGVRVSFPPDGAPIMRMRQGLEQAGFEAGRAIDEQMDQYERVRLLYVACTRARDHLVVSLHRIDDDRPDPSLHTGARLLADCVTDDADAAALAGIQAVLDRTDAPPRPPAAAPTAAPPRPAVEDLGRWRVERARLLATARLPGSVSATGLAARALAAATPPPPPSAVEPAGEEDEARFGELGTSEERAAADDADEAEPGLAKRPVDLDLPAWRKGRYGTAIGRAVHAVLQAVDLASGEGVEALSLAQAAAEGVDGEHTRIARLARSALGAPSVVEAAAGEHWREVYVGVPIGGRVLEGYVDLLYRRPDGLVVVDHKTDRVGTDEEAASKLDAYRLQLAAYALAIEQATGERVVAAKLVFCAVSGAREEEVRDLRAAMAEAEALVAHTG